MRNKTTLLTELQENLDAQNDLLLDLRNLLQEYMLVTDNTIKELEAKLK